MKNETILEIELFLQRLIHKYDRALVTLGSEVVRPLCKNSWYEIAIALLSRSWLRSRAIALQKLLV